MRQKNIQHEYFPRITVRASLSLSATMPKMQIYARTKERASSLTLAAAIRSEKCQYKNRERGRITARNKIHFHSKTKKTARFDFLISLKRSRIVCERFLIFNHLPGAFGTQTGVEVIFGFYNSGSPLRRSALRHFNFQQS